MGEKKGYKNCKRCNTRIRHWNYDAQEGHCGGCWCMVLTERIEKKHKQDERKKTLKEVEKIIEKAYSDSKGIKIQWLHDFCFNLKEEIKKLKEGE